MPLYLDIHRNLKTTPEEIKAAHLSDLEAQHKHGAKFIKYWFDEAQDRVCCMVEAPNAEAVNAVHSEAHGSVADEVIEVESNIIEAFLGGPSDEIGCALTVDGTLDGGFRTVLFTDMVGSTSLTQELGDRASMELLGVHDAIIRRELLARNGREIKHTGDGLMASFVSASSAIECSLGIQRAFKNHRERTPDRPINVRIGMSAGEPIDHNQDLFGATVQLASRVCNEAEAGEILVSNVVRELCVGKGFDFVDRGPATLKGFPEPVQLHEVSWV